MGYLLIWIYLFVGLAANFKFCRKLAFVLGYIKKTIGAFPNFGININEMKKFEDKSLELKNGKKVVIRQAEVRDAEKLLKCIKTYVPQSNYIPKLEQEIKLNVEQEVEWINSFRINDNSILLIAEYDNQILGNIDLTGNRRKMMEHTAVVGMGILQEWRNSGLGTALLSSAIEWAKLNSALELVWLQVYTENKIAINLYRKIGFKEKGIIKNFFKQEGRYFDNLTMVMNV